MEKEKRSAIIAKYGQKDKDTGSPEVQVALLTDRITNLAGHLAKFKKDKHNQRGLILLVSQRKTLLKYLKRVSLERYSKLTQSLGIR